MDVPVIDFSKLNGEDRAETLAQIHTSCKEWGFFQLVNHGISVELLEQVKKLCADCYKQEREQGFLNNKSKEVREILNQLKEKNVAATDNNEQKEINGVDWEDVFLLLDDNEWACQIPGFKETMTQYRSEIKNLTEAVMEVMDENLGLPIGYIKQTFNNNNKDSAFFGTKVAHYPPCPYPETLMALRAHTDAGGVILLYQDDKVQGLQILKDGNWVDVKPVPNAIVVNTGDQIEVLSNGRYKSVWHRVVPSLDGNRRSVASFYNPSLKATIAPAVGLIEEKNGNLIGDDHGIGSCTTYPKFVFGDYMSVYAKQKFLPKEPRFQAVKDRCCTVMGQLN